MKQQNNRKIRTLYCRFAQIIGLVAATLLSPFDGKGETWDGTRYEYEPATGSLIKKIYPDGHEISYTYYDDLLPKRITYASGKWMERNYNSRRHAVSTIYSSQDTPAIYSAPNELGTVCKLPRLRFKLILTDIFMHIRGHNQ